MKRLAAVLMGLSFPKAKMHIRYLDLTLLAIMAVFSLNACGKVVGYRYQTCKTCESVRCVKTQYRFGIFVKDQEVSLHYMSPSFGNCSHIWEDGVSSSVDEVIADGTVVLVRKGNAYGGFTLTDQATIPERMRYAWIYRSDGKGLLDSKDPNVQTGNGEGTRITFGPFDISWSGNQDGRGFIYYNHIAGDKVEPSDLHICVTNEPVVEEIDASAREWIYKGSPTDM